MKKVFKLLVAFAIVLLSVSMSSGETASAWEVRIGEQKFDYRGTFDGIGTRLGNAEEQKCYPEFTEAFINTYLKPLYVGGYDSCYVTYTTSGVKNDCRGKIVALLPDVKTMDSLSYDPLRCLENLRITDSTGKALVLEVVQIGHEGTGYRYALLSHGTDLNSLITDGMITTTEESCPHENSSYITCYTMEAQIKGYFPGLSVVQNGYAVIRFPEGGCWNTAGKLYGETTLYPRGARYGGYCRSFSSKVDLNVAQKNNYVKIGCEGNVVPLVTLGITKQPDRVHKFSLSLVQESTGKKTAIYQKDIKVQSLASWQWSGYESLSVDCGWAIKGRLNELFSDEILTDEFVLVRKGSTDRTGTTELIICVGENNWTEIDDDYYNCKTSEERVNYLYNAMIWDLKHHKYVTAGQRYTFRFYTGAKNSYSQGTYVGWTKRVVQ